MPTRILGALLVVSFAVQADDAATDVRSGCKPKTFSNLTVCNLLKARTAQICGALTAASFNTPSGPFFSGLRNYALVTNQGATANNTFVLWTSAESPILTPGITLNATTGVLTLPTGGVFLVGWVARFQYTPLMGVNPSENQAIAQLLQTHASVFTIYADAIVNSNLEVDTPGVQTPAFQPVVTGLAIVTTTSANDNQLALRIGFTVNGGMTFPSTDNPDANAQLVVLQLN